MIEGEASSGESGRSVGSVEIYLDREISVVISEFTVTIRH